MAIKRISALTKLGVFRKYAAAGDDCDLKKLNLIYGFNGSGKTTLARVFTSLQQGEVSELLPEGGGFDIELEDGATISSTVNLDALKGKIAVFNTDFVEDNFQWKEGSAKPVFYIGKEQAEAGRLLDAAERRLEPLKVKRTAAADAERAATRNFGQFKTTTARTIGEQTSHRAFNAGHLDRLYQQGDCGPEKLLDEHRRTELRSILLKDAPLPKLPEQVGVSGFGALSEQALKCLSQTVATTALSELTEHPAMANWVRAGHHYHREHGLVDCLFCGNPITPERMRAIESALDDSFDRLAAQTRELITQFGDLRQRVTAATSSLPSKNDVAVDQQAYEEATRAYRDAATRLLDASQPFDEALSKKAEAPNSRIEAVGCCDLPALQALEQSAAAALERVNALIRAHNRSHDDFASTQQAAQGALREHYLAEACEEYRRLEKEQQDTGNAAAQVEEDYMALVGEIENLTQEMRAHGPAAALISNMVKSYLGHGDIEIAAENEGYQLRRNGKPVGHSLSEGEKTAIALCYFLSSLTADGRKIKDLIVIVDDPISSLDSKALNYAFSVLKAYVSGAHQLLILTHNVNFMNECRKWLRKKEEKGNAALLFLDMRIVDGSRQTTLAKLPKLLRDYDSEYHYLFSLVKEFAESAAGAETYFFLMPNAMRKVAEVFLAFKRPGPNGLGDKIDALAKEADQLGLDGHRFRALDRLVQVESHGDSLEDLIAFSSMAVEETHQCAVALMEMIEKLDPEHHKRLCGQCN